ncbi:MAG: NADH-quinone oxidoreductase subunit D [Flavobacteriales bacterium]|nr:NADH-quinone oxidoreductase subunit D [Flavobacteriales bacterium]HRN37616.1 NADH-quinone oxidoreductase subunit D [Flavobacteriales bacterium]HRO39354.1 NADH-quinone oxidoreductase subunit D [Flavobacteriales bacterium]HRP80667.1 NADH-quinone oxidoreductase subunit D [Flavobacteriales bacterium]
MKEPAARPDLWTEDQVPGEGLKELTTLNLGPTHPATHGIFQNVLTLDGEIILDTEQTIGYIHRAFEKICERRPFYQITTLTDRMNYCSAPINNFGWHMAVEKLLGIDLPQRVEYMRVIIMELSRITDHIICNTIICQDSGATTPFLYVYQWREKIYEVYEEICGARLTTNMGRIGGFERNFTELAWQRIRSIIKELPAVLDEFDKLMVRNRIFMDRCINCGPISAERALQWGFTGPNLRAAGVDYDVRVADPYSAYKEFDFAIPVGRSGDVYDRYTVRQEEMRQSISIVRQALDKLDKISDKTTYHADVPDWVLPPKEEVYNDMEALIYHFKIVMGEVEVPVGEIYHCVEGGNGELGFYIVSDGGKNPFRVHLRRPCFIYYQAFPEIIKGGMLSDAILTMSSLNVIAGELDA